MPLWRSFFGIAVLLLLAWAMSSDRRRIPWRAVIVGMLLQFTFAAIMLRTRFGIAVIDQVRIGATSLLDCVDVGCRFVFGTDFQEHFFAFKIVPTIIFMGALMSLLYHFGILQRVVAAVGWVMKLTMGTSGAESLCAAANIFVGQTEAPLVVKPYLDRMTSSELMAVMVGGYATIAGGVMAAFIEMGIDAGHLLTASVISAPAALVVAKLMQPEVGTPETTGTLQVANMSEAENAIDALTRGAADGLKLGVNIAAMIIAFLAMIAVVDLLLKLVGQQFGVALTLSDMLGYLCSPLAWLMAVNPGDERAVGSLIGLKIVTNEFLAYEELVKLINLNQLGPQSKLVAIYALCGFANLGSLGIQIGGLGMLAPHRRRDLARLGWRAMLGGNLACFLTACVATIVSP
jgi:concentrative nucleoside transporter, CNT family